MSFAASTRIMLPDGSYETIQNICNNPDITEVMSFNTNIRGLEPKPIFSRSVEDVDSDDWYHVYSISSGGITSTLNLTSNHKIWVYSSEDFDTSTYTYAHGSYRQVTDVKNLVESHFPGYQDVQFVSVSNATPYMNLGVVVNFVHLSREFDHKYNLVIEGNHNFIANGIVVSE